MILAGLASLLNKLSISGFLLFHNVEYSSINLFHLRRSLIISNLMLKSELSKWNLLLPSKTQEPLIWQFWGPFHKHQPLSTSKSSLLSAVNMQLFTQPHSMTMSMTSDRVCKPSNLNNGAQAWMNVGKSHLSLILWVMRAFHLDLYWQSIKRIWGSKLTLMKVHWMEGSSQLRSREVSKWIVNPLYNSLLLHSWG